MSINASLKDFFLFQLVKKYLYNLEKQNKNIIKNEYLEVIHVYLVLFRTDKR